MLLRNESIVKHHIEVKLVFDDNTTKELEIAAGDMVSVSYKRNGGVEQGTGIVKKITPFIKRFCDSKVVEFESATITIDMSSSNNARVETIALCDIVDITLTCTLCPYYTPTTTTCPITGGNCIRNVTEETVDND